MNFLRMLYTIGTWVNIAIGVVVLYGGDYQLATMFFIFSMIFTQAKDTLDLRVKVMYAEHNLRSLYIAMRLGDAIEMRGNDDELEKALDKVKEDHDA